MTFDGQRLTLEVDGELVYSYAEELRPLLGDDHTRAGIYIYNPGWIDNVALYSKAVDSEVLSQLNRPVLPEAIDLKPGDRYRIPLEGAEWAGIARPAEMSTEGVDGGAPLELGRIGMTRAATWFRIRPDTIYELSGWFRSALDEQPSRMLFDIRYHDADRNPISNLEMVAYPATDEPVQHSSD